MANNAIAAKAKAVYGSFLTTNDYNSLLQRTSVSSAVSFLKNTPRYAPVFADINENTIHRGQVEELLGKQVFNDCIRMRKFSSAKKDSILNFYIKKTESEQLIKAIAAIKSNNQQGFYLSFPVYMMDFLSFNPEEIASCKDLKELAVLLKKNRMYKPLLPYLEAEKTDMNKCVNVINCCYLKWAFSSIDRDFKGSRNKLLKQFILRKTDMDNVLLCYRLKKFFDADEERIKELILPYHYRVKEHDIDDALKSQNPTDSLIMLLSERCVPKNIAVDESFPEMGALKSDYIYFRHRLAIATNETEAVFALLILAENERINLQKIIEGIRYGELPSEIEKLVII